MSKQLAFEGIQRKRPKRHDLEDQFALDALKKQSLCVLEVIKENPGQYPEKILKLVNKTGKEFQACHVRASLKWLVDHSIVTKDTRDRVSYYTAKEIA